MEKIKEIIRKIIGRISPKLLVNILYYISNKELIDWDKPRNLNEKIQWLKFYSDTTLWPDLADKYKVRSYVESLGLSDTLVKLYGVWDSVDDINWSALPKSYVMKVNNGCGDVRICKNGDIDIENWKHHFSKALEIKMGYWRGEPHYNKIKPLIIAEELLDHKQQSIESSSLIDYKFWCCDGVPYCVLCCSNRQGKNIMFSLYDMNWNNINDKIQESEHYKCADYDIPKPESYEYMIDIVKKLSAPFPHVRVDLYEVAGKPYFGELTFTSAGGYVSYFKKDFLIDLGNNITTKSVN